MIGMENLPDEIVLKILGYLDLGDLNKCARVCKRLNNICKGHSLRISVISRPDIKNVSNEKTNSERSEINP